MLGGDYLPLEVEHLLAVGGDGSVVSAVVAGGTLGVAS